MDIKANFYAIHVSEEEKDKTHTWGVANVICDGLVIPNIRAINRKLENGEWGHFFAYPRIKVGDRYQDVLKLTSDQRKEIENALFFAARDFAMKENPKIEVDSIHTFSEKQPLIAIADVRVNGMGIRGVRLYQSKGGERFAQLPQYQDKNGEWHNLINFDNSMFAMPALTRELETAYEKEKLEQKQEQSRRQKR